MTMTRHTIEFSNETGNDNYRGTSQDHSASKSFVILCALSDRYSEWPIEKAHQDMECLIDIIPNAAIPVPKER